MPAAEIARMKKMLGMVNAALVKQKIALAKRKSRAIKKAGKSKSKGKKRTSPIGLKALGFY